MQETQTGVNSFQETEKIGKLMRKYAVPCVISLLVAALYNIVDQLFIANASYLGSYGNAANTVVYPMTVIALSIAVMIGDGCCAFVSICLGRKQAERAHRSVGNAIVLCVGASIILTAIYFIFQEGILTFFGGHVNDETYKLSKEYFTWISVGIPFYMFGQAMNPVIRSDGSPKFAMATTLSGCAINIVLDPIFIYVCKWGMMGAAIATILGQIVTAILSIRYMTRTKSVTLEKSSFKIDIHLDLEFLALGICSFLSQISLVASMAAIQNMVVKYGAQDSIFGQTEYSQIPMAVLGIVMKFFQIVISIAIGLAAGCIPIVGYNVGAKHNDRTRELMKKLLLSEFVVGLIALFIVECFPNVLIGLFGAANESVYYTQFAVRSFRIYLCLMPLATVNKGTFIFLQSLGKAGVSTGLSMVREVVFGVGFALLLPMFFGLSGVLYSMPVSDFLTFIISIVVITKTWKELSVDPAPINAKEVTV